jgi:excinuclease ABC subunit C
MRGRGRQLEFETAARLRDRLASVTKAIEKQQMVADRSEDLDVIGVADDELEASVQVFFVRRGRVVGRKGFVVDKVEDLTEAELIGNILEGLYYDYPPLGVPEVGAGARRVRGRRPLRAVADRGARLQGADPGAPAGRQAGAARDGHPQRRGGLHPAPPASGRDHNSRAQALNELQEQLGLPEAPLRIECYDMSHIQGTDYVGSMVVVEDGLPKKSEYRRFKIRDVPGNDDYAAMAEVLTRRFKAYLEERSCRSPSATASSATRPTCCSSTAARASSAWR